MFKVHTDVCKYAMLLCISLKHRPQDRLLGLLQHAYRQNGDETSLISSEIECMGLGNYEISRSRGPNTHSEE